MRTLLVLSVHRVARSLVFCTVFWRSLLVLLSFYFGQCIICLSLIFGFWLHLWFLHTSIFLRLYILAVNVLTLRPVHVHPLFHLNTLLHNTQPNITLQSPRVSDCCLPQGGPFFCHIMARTSCIWMRWWWYPLIYPLYFFKTYFICIKNANGIGHKFYKNINKKWLHIMAIIIQINLQHDILRL